MPLWVSGVHEKEERRARLQCLQVCFLATYNAILASLHGIAIFCISVKPCLSQLYTPWWHLACTVTIVDLCTSHVLFVRHIITILHLSVCSQRLHSCKLVQFHCLHLSLLHERNLSVELPNNQSTNFNSVKVQQVSSCTSIVTVIVFHGMFSDSALHAMFCVIYMRGGANIQQHDSQIQNICTTISSLCCAPYLHFSLHQLNQAIFDLWLSYSSSWSSKLEPLQLCSVAVMRCLGQNFYSNSASSHWQAVLPMQRPEWQL